MFDGVSGVEMGVVEDDGDEEGVEFGVGDGVVCPFGMKKAVGAQVEVVLEGELEGEGFVLVLDEVLDEVVEVVDGVEEVVAVEGAVEEKLYVGGVIDDVEDVDEGGLGVVDDVVKEEDVAPDAILNWGL